ncbi:phosphonate ABC transporter ATP-binding protein [Szabonella alba]|uniref:ATP-binding cassette domain-containing protein n=1 Tax=Szabonella alba TaxID=2804194 RepID=A0A8K0VFG6_9RHOB|nr:ATP-binding cassette domain-containing protein [Szabonella alba]MBL4919303.1 ATP-binding cassette domain-containing protein [Szabonella alba]
MRMPDAAKPPVLRAHEIHVRFGALHVLRGVSFDLARGEGAVLLGANGCGKSTLLRTLNGLATVESGRVDLNGRTITDAPSRVLRAARRQLGYVFQHFNLVPQLSAHQNVLFGAMGQRRFGVLSVANAFARTEDRERAMQCLERVGLADRATHRPAELSGGQQQRVAIARMLMQAPQVVIADEPIASLDPKAGREVLELLWRIVEEEGLSLLCTLHQLDLAQEFGKRIIGMKAGRVVLDAASPGIDRADLDALYQGAVRVDAAPTPQEAAA